MKKRQSIFAAALLLVLVVFAVSFSEAHVIKKETVKTEISQKLNLTIEVIKSIELEGSALCSHYAAIAPGIFTIEVPEIGSPATYNLPGSIRVRCSFRPVLRGPPKLS